MKGEEIILAREQTLWFDRHRSRRRTLGNDQPAFAVLAQPLEVEGGIVATNNGAIRLRPAPDDALGLKIMVNIHQLANPLELPWVPGIARHVEIDTEQPAPIRLIIVVGIPDVGNVAGFVRWQ